MVGITYYNEEKSLLCRSLHSIITACRSIQTRKHSDFWNKAGPAWQKLVVCITIDGLRAADRGALDVLAAIGVYRRGLLRETINDKPVRAHVVSEKYSHQVQEANDAVRIHHRTLCDRRSQDWWTEGLSVRQLDESLPWSCPVHPNHQERKPRKTQLLPMAVQLGIEDTEPRSRCPPRHRYQDRI